MSNKHIVHAVLSDEAYRAFMSGEAVDRNGFRSKSGYFWPDQPSFIKTAPRSEVIKDSLVNIGITATACFVMDVVLPAAKRIVDEKVIPCIMEKIDKFKNEDRKVAADRETADRSESERIINFKDYIKSA